MEGDKGDSLERELSAEAREYSGRRQSDKHSSGYESLSERDISLSGSWDSRRSSLAWVTEFPPVDESHHHEMIHEGSSSHFTMRDPMPGTSRLTKNGAKLPEQSQSELNLNVDYDDFSHMTIRSPLLSRRFSQIHPHKPQHHYHKPRSKDDSDLIIRKERSILLTSRGRELKMMQTDFHKKRPHLWKHTSSWTQSFRHQCSVLDTPAFSDLPSSKQRTPFQPLSMSSTSLSGDLPVIDITPQTLIKMELSSSTDSEMKTLSPVYESATSPAEISPLVPIVTVQQPETPESMTTHEAYFQPLKPVDKSPTDPPLSKHISFKKYLQHRYLSSLRDSASTEDDTSIDSSGDPHEGSVEREIFYSSGISIEVDKPDDDDDCVIVEGAEARDDNEVFTSIDVKHESLSQRLARQRLTAYRRESPVDLSTQPDTFTQAHLQRTDQHTDDSYLSASQQSPHLSPTMHYQRNVPMYYSTKQELLSPRSPLWSVPEGHVFNFSVPNSPFDTRPHSDPEFVSTGFSPAFSPDSPVQFTFPSKAADKSGESRMPKSPRLMLSKSQEHISSGKQLTKLYSSPPPAEQLLSSESLITGELSYVCPICGQVFPTYDNLAKHMAKHLPTETVKSADNNKIHYCRICERSFSRSDMLTRHMRLHTGLKPYECRVCGQVFSRSDHLNTHQRTHTGVKPYRCPQCPYAACRRDMITRHMRIHTKRSGKRGEGSGDGKEPSTSKYLSVYDPDSSELRKSSTSSLESLRPQTCSLSSVDSIESDAGSRKHSLTSLESFEHEQRSLRLQRSSTESTDVDEGIGGIGRGSYSSRQSRDVKYLDPYMSYRKSRHWSMTSSESLESENPRSDSLTKTEPSEMMEYSTVSSPCDPVTGDPIPANPEEDIAQKFKLKD